jgi:hypothetical protein
MHSQNAHVMATEILVLHHYVINIDFQEISLFFAKMVKIAKK